MASDAITVAIAETSLLDRDLLLTALQNKQGIEVIGTAPSGSLALKLAARLQPDIMLYDSEIQDIPCNIFISQLAQQALKTGLIITTRKNAAVHTVERIVESLELGAFDFYHKIDPAKLKAQNITSDSLLTAKIRIFSIQHYSRLARGLHNPKVALAQNSSTEILEERTFPTLFNAVSQYSLLAVGVSTGGPEALKEILMQLPINFPIPIVIVIHMPKMFTQYLAKRLDKLAKIKVVESVDQQILNAGTVYLAQGGVHSRVIRQGNKFVLLQESGPPVNGCTPSVDVLFTSMAEICNRDMIATILTGMGEDGVRGLGLLQAKGAKTYAQDKETSLVWGMPGSAFQAGFVDELVGLPDIAKCWLQVLDYGKK